MQRNSSLYASQIVSQIENLEPRKLLSASLKGGVLRAIGEDAAANVINVALSTDKTKYDVSINGTTTSFDVSKVRRVIVHGGSLADSLTVGSDVNTRQNLFGYDGNDTLTGGSAADVTAVTQNNRRGPRGWTRLWGMGGDDTIIATGGRNFVDGGLGNDNITGSAGRDLIAGFKGNDTINAGAGNDVVFGGDGDDVINLGDGNDRCLAGRGNDNVIGGAGNDRIFGQDGNDTIAGGIGDDILYGILGADSLLGEDGNDTLVGGGDVDVLDGGAGTNKLVQRDSPNTDSIVNEVTTASI